MRNLKLLKHYSNRLEIQNVQLALQLGDNHHETVITHNLKVLKVNSENGLSDILFDICKLIPVAIGDINVVGLAYFTVEHYLVCALDNGDVVRFDTELSHIIDVSTIFPSGIKAMKVSPDNELLVFISRDNVVHMTDCRLELLNTSPLLDEQFGQGEFINVGWGKKETQFHGSEGKEAAKKPTVTQDIQTENEKEDDAVITWRGDSALFAVCYFHNAQYIFKVFDREGVLQYTSEKQTGIECQFAWRPSGNLIATSQQFPNKYVVAFFEKNGLKHGEFVLPFKKSDVEIKQINWSSDSEILCVWYLDISTKTSFIHLYTVNNYRWYLKYSLKFNKDIASLFWDETNTTGCEKLLHIFLSSGEYLNYNWVWCVNGSKGKTSNDKALVGVIDGKKVLLTSFRKAVIPPPMSEWALEADSNINQVIFGPPFHANRINSNCFALFKDNCTIDFYKINEGNNIEELWKCSLKEMEINATVNNITQLLWITDNTMIGICSYTNNSKIIVMQLSAENSSMNEIKEITVDEELIGLCPYNNNKVLFQTTIGKLIVYSLNDDKIIYLPFSFPEPCHEIDISHTDETTYVYGLTSRYRFYINEQEVAKGVNSFFVHSDFLIMTTLQHQLLCCPISINLTNISSLGNMDTKNKYNASISSRKLERGSKIVTAVSGDSRVVLQLPRGNVEAIQPRALSLKIIGIYLDTLEYYKAFDLMRKQRINLNLLYDHNPQKFIENIEKFISQVNNVSWISLFVSDLDDHDVTQTMYSTSYLDKNQKIEPLNDKIKKICELMRKSLENLNENNKYILPIITTYVKTNNVHDLERALLLIKNLNSQKDNGLISAEEAMKYLLYMVNVNKLYDIALGLYDFDLVMFVARKSQKDPKEYVPFLNTLKSMDENYRCFSIDDFLKRHESALKHLVNCGDERQDELLLYIKKHNLHKNALNIIHNTDPRHANISECFGNYLMSHRKYKQAGIVFMRCANLSKALNAFTEACDWSSTMFIIESLNLESLAVNEIKTKLLLDLKERKHYNDAFELLSYSGDASPSDLIDCCFEGHMYKKVIGVCAKFKTEDLVESYVQPLVLKHYSSMLGMIVQNEGEFLKQNQRLRVVRQTKKEREELGEEMLDDCDLYSDTSSIMTSSASRSSGRTFRSSKNRRKHERKLVSLKEGSKFEDVALIRSLHGLVSNSFELRKDVGELSFLLQWLGKDEEMLKLQSSLDKILTQMNESKCEIWTTDLWADRSNQTSEETGDNLNTMKNDLSDAMLSLEPHLKIPPVIQQIDWKSEPLS